MPSIFITIVMLGVLWATDADAAQPENAAVMAAQIGLPMIDEPGATAGPFAGPDGTLYYMDGDQRLTFFHPYQYTAFFGELDDGVIRYHYALTPTGQFIVDANNQAQQVPVLPDAVYQWPHAEAVANVLIQYLLAIQQGQIAAPTQSADWSGISAASAALHESTMGILDNMGSEGCIDHYEDVYYLGCW